MWKFIFSKPYPSKTEYEYKLVHSHYERKSESTRILKKYPNMVPIILEKSDQSNINDIEKHSYIFPRAVTFSAVIIKIRKLLNIPSSRSLYFFINNQKVPRTTDNLGDLYRIYKDKDLFLYITYT